MSPTLNELDDMAPHTSEWIISRIPFALLSLMGAFDIPTSIMLETFTTIHTHFGQFGLVKALS